MPRQKKTKDSFKRDEQGRTILGSAKEMAEWVKLGFEEQEKRKSQDIPFDHKYIDLSNCVLYISYPIGSKEPASQIFNLCDMAGIVPGIEKKEGDPNYLFEVKQDIFLDGSVLYGNFFHYVKFDGTVRLDNVTVKSTCSFFKCLFEGFAFMQNIQITGRCDFEQCDFKKGLIMAGAKADLFQFNYCTVQDRLSLASATLVNHNNEGYHQSIEITNSKVENLNLSKVRAEGLPVYIGDSEISGLRMDNVTHEASLVFNSCKLGGIFTMVKDEKSPDNHIREVELHSCDVEAQIHVECSRIEKFAFNFCKIDDKGRLRLSQCTFGDLQVVSSSVFGQMDVVGSEITSIGLEETYVPGYINFQGNSVKKYADRHTLRLLKNEALKVNDDVEATHLYAKEMEILLADKKIPFGDKISLWLNKWFSGFGVKWGRALFVTLAISVILTLLMLGFGSSKYAFIPTGEFMGLGGFITVLLDSINVFSIPLFGDTIKEYGLNVCGQILYFIIKIVVAYGSYQFVTAFRKYGRK